MAGVFLEGIHKSAMQAIQTTNLINQLFEEDITQIEKAGRARFVCKQVLEYMKLLPQVNVSMLAKGLDITAPTARHALELMRKLNILEETSGKKRDKIYVYRKYLNILEEGTEPFTITSY